MPVPEARMAETAGGLEPQTDGWFVVNTAAAGWRHNDAFGEKCRFEARERPFPQIAVSLVVLHPGRPNCMYHGEDIQEDFLVLSGECLLLVEGQERRLQAWDFVHCPAWTEHVFVGAGDGPCAVLMVGARPDVGVVYPVADVALRHGAGVTRETRSPDEAYAPFPESVPARPDGLALPWSG
ncbi:MAG TPA: cupin domain-containing protein [Gaiellales bacterium]|jgi:uncharacterized cupin superfamily protein|nr:cupin domain-containing protein [Gaiellales bacterium]